MKPLAQIATACFLLSLVPSGWAIGAEKEYPQIPESAVKRFNVSLSEELLESIRIQRLELRGSHTIVMDYPGGHRISNNVKGVSVAMTHKTQGEKETRLYALPKGVFSSGLSPALVNKYLEGKQAVAKPEIEFEIIEQAEDAGGKAKFRFGGTRALTIRYSEMVGGKRVLVTEAWAEVDGAIFIAAVQAPERSFNSYFRTISAIFNSMRFE